MANTDLEEFNKIIANLMLPQKEGTHQNERQRLLKAGMENAAASASSDAKEREIFELGEFIKILRNQLEKNEIVLYTAVVKLIEKIKIVSLTSRQKPPVLGWIGLGHSVTADCLDAFVKLNLGPIINNKEYQVLDAKHQMSSKSKNPLLNTHLTDLNKFLNDVIDLSNTLTDQKNKDLFYDLVNDAYINIHNKLEKIDEDAASQIKNTLIKRCRFFLYTLTDTNVDILRDTRRKLIKLMDANFNNVIEFDTLLSDITFNEPYKSIFEKGKNLEKIDAQYANSEKLKRFYQLGEKITTERNFLNSNMRPLYRALYGVHLSMNLIPHETYTIASYISNKNNQLEPYLEDLIKASEKGDMRKVLRSLQNSVFRLDDNYDHKIALHAAAEKNQLNIMQFLLEMGASVDITDLNQSTPLHIAAKHGHYKVAKLLIEAGANVNGKNIHGDTALHYAAAYGHVEIAQLLLAYNADTKVKNKNNLTPSEIAYAYKQEKTVNLFYKKEMALLNAVRKNDLEEAKKCVADGAEIRFHDYSTGNAPLHIAASLGNVEMLTFLLSNGATILSISKKKDLALHVAAFHGQVDALKYLYSKMLEVSKSPLETKGAEGATVLIRGVFSKKVEVIQLLLELKANINAVDDLGNTALHYAAQLGYQDIFHELMSHHPDIAIENKEKLKSADLAKKAGHTAIYDVLQGNKENFFVAVKENNLSIVTGSLMNGVDVNLTNEDGETALHIAARFGRKEITQYLLEKGADLFARNKSGSTPLHIAASGHLSIVKLLLIQSQKNEIYKNYINEKDSQHRTPIDIAKEFQGKDIVPFLDEYMDERGNLALFGVAVSGDDGYVEFKYKLNFIVKNSFGNTFLHVAAYHGHINIVKYLLENDPDLANMTNPQGETALHYAAKQGYENIVSLLLKFGCTNIENNAGKTASQLAENNGYYVIAKLIKDANTTVSLVSSGVNMFPDTTQRPKDERDNTFGLDGLTL